MPQHKESAIVPRRWFRAAWDRVLGGALIAGGGVFVAAGYLGASGTRRISEQAAYLASGGLGGLFLLGCGATLLLSADLRDLGRQLDAAESVMSSLPALAGQDSQWEVPSGTAAGHREVELARGGR
jgi:hypothetical protein